MAFEPPPRTPFGSRAGAERLAWLAAILVPCALRAATLTTRGVDPDELEHLHVARMVGLGQLPYRDFFEHHGPLLYYAVQPLAGSFDGGLERLWPMRWAMWCCSLGTLAATFALGRHVGGWRAGAAAAALLSWNTVFHYKSIELRPDVPAAFCVLLAAWLALRADPGGNALGAGRRFARCCLLAAVAGMATLFTQKTIVPLCCLGGACWLVPARAPRRLGWPRKGLVMAAGVLLAWLAAGALFTLADGGGAFWNSTVVQLWIWPVRSGKWEHLRPTLAGDLGAWLAALAELLALLGAYRRCLWPWQVGQHNQAAPADRAGGPSAGRADCANREPLLLGLATAGCLASLGLVKATFPQYYLLWMPLVCLCAARRLCRWFELLSARFNTPAVALASAALLLTQGALVARGLSHGVHGSLPHLAANPQSAATVASACGVAGLAWLLALCSAVRRRRAAASIVLLIVLGQAYGILRLADSLGWSNASQRNAIDAVHARVAPHQTILDGFTGYGALRPHAIYHWWLNEYSLALVDPIRLEQDILRVLAEQPPAAILFDDNLRRLGPRVQARIEELYQPASPEPLWLPKTAPAKTPPVP